jgi:hypothetical protein
LKDVDFQLRGGRVPQKVERSSAAHQQPTEALEPPPDPGTGLV